MFSLTHCAEKPDYDKLKVENDSLHQRITRERAGVRLDHSVVEELTSKYTNESYDIYISYPPDFKTSGKEYPVLIVLDAEVNFGGVTYISQRLTKDNLVPELLIVGIAYKGETDEETYYSVRSKDFTPSSDKSQEERHGDKFNSGSGGAENFVKFLSLELFPYLKDNYPIRADNRTIYGHSFGGLFGFHVLLRHPALFDNYLLLSPSLWWNTSEILKDPKVISIATSTQLKLYVGTGSLEDSMVNEHLEMIGKLKHLGVEKLKVKSEILDQETHRTVFGRGFTNGLRFLFQAK